ncbi:MAG TPA: AraC family transcriptional regulator [Caulobacteraceae bacterium]|jgi:AraC-like DNA-binding protein
MDQPAPRSDDLKLEVSRGADEGWDTPVMVWSSQKPFEYRTPSRGYHTLTVRLSGSRGLSFLDTGGAWRPKPLGAALVIRPAEMQSGLSGANPVRFADICLPVDLTRQLCASLFNDVDSIRPFGAHLVFCSDDRLCADATALVERALDEKDRPTRFEMNARAHLFALDLLKRHSPLSPTCEKWFGGLAPWQAKRAEELMLKNLAEDLRLADVAAACELSAAHFSRSFHKTFGAPPYRWLQTRRIERAKTLLADSKRPLAEIALECGFTEQSHFTKVFTRLVGVSPGAWRRLRRA